MWLPRKCSDTRQAGCIVLTENEDPRTGSKVDDKRKRYADEQPHILTLASATCPCEPWCVAAALD
jgi:hypothetical protein